MSIIEGIGDEVTILVSVLILATTLLFAWFSTFVSDRTSFRNTSPSTERANGEDTIEADIGIGEGGVEHVLPESVSSSGTEAGAISADAAHIEQDCAENSNRETVLSESRTGLAESGDVQADKSSEHPQESTVCESSSLESVKRRLVGQNHCSSAGELNSVVHNTDIQTDESQSVGSRQTSLDGDQSSQVSAGNPSNTQQNGQSDEETVTDSPPPEGSVFIRIKYLTDREREVYANPRESLAEFKQRIFTEEINSGQTVRLIFNGHLLQDERATLFDLNITQNCVIHCLLSQNVAPSDLHPDVHETDVDLGRFMIPLFTCILGFVWYLRWQYRYMFNATSTLSLIGVTSLFMLAVLASWRG